MQVGRAVVGLVSSIIIGGYFLFFAGAGLHASLNTDDLVNLPPYADASALTLLKTNLLYFSPAYRPMGGLFYAPLFALAGLHPLPYRVVCFLLLSLNLVLLYLNARCLTRSSHVALLTTLIFAFIRG